METRSAYLRGITNYKSIKMRYVFLLYSFLTSQFFYGQEIVGNTDFNPVDRIAVKNVIDAYGVYWDTNQLDKWLSLFTDDAIDSRITDNKESISKTKANSKMYQERMSYFIKNKMQRRHMMTNTLFTNQTNSSVDVEQYMMLITTNSNSNTEIVTPIFYKFRFEKNDGIWKINYRQIKLDKKLDLPMPIKD